MKKIVALFCLMVVMAGIASAGPSLNLGRGYALMIDTSLNIDGVGAFDFKHSQWMTGASKDLLLVNKGPKQVLYLSGENLFNLNEKGKGAFGLALGTPIGTLTSKLDDLIGHILPDKTMPIWLSNIGNWVSVEAGASYRIFGCPEGQTPMVYTVGGKLRIPVEDFKKLFGGK